MAGYKPGIMTGFNNKELCNWFDNTLAAKKKEIAEYKGDYDTVDGFKEAAIKLRPDILIILRENETGGLPQSAELALWALENSYQVILVIGELDDGYWAFSRDEVRKKGGTVICWEKGGDQSVFYLMNLVITIVKDLAAGRKPIAAPGANGAETRQPIGDKLPQVDVDISEEEAEAEAVITAAPEVLPEAETVEEVVAEKLPTVASGTEPAQPYGGVPRSETHQPEEMRQLPPVSATPDTVMREPDTTAPATKPSSPTPSAPTEGTATQVAKVLLATGHNGIDQEIAGLIAGEFELVGECYDRRVIAQVASELRPDSVVISPYLKGEGEISAIVRDLRNIGVRVVVLPGDINSEQAISLVGSVLPLGVYDYVFDRVTAEQIVERLRTPARLGDVPSHLADLAMTEQTVSDEVLSELREIEASSKPSKKQNPLVRLKKLFGRKAPDVDSIASGGAGKQAAGQPPIFSGGGGGALPEQAKSAGLSVAMGEEAKNKAPQPAPNHLDIGNIKEKLNMTSIFSKATPKAAPEASEAKRASRVRAVAGQQDSFGGYRSIAFVTPWRPGLAGRLAAAAAMVLAADEDAKVSVIGASGNSIVASCLGISEDELILSDWRSPGAQAPVIRNNIKIWAVDAAKSLHMRIDLELGMTISKAQKNSAWVIVDCSDDHNLANELTFQDVAVAYVVPVNDPVEYNTAMLWFNRLKNTGKNIVFGVDLRDTNATMPKWLNPDIVIRESPEAAIKELLRKVAIPANQRN